MCDVSVVASEYNCFFIFHNFLCSLCKIVFELVGKGGNMSSFTNAHACLSHHKTSIRGKIQDYVISFNQNQHDLNEIVNQTCELVEQLFSSFSGKRVSGRLIAKVNFTHFNSETGQDSNRAYHFPSYQSEEVIDVEDFFTMHMMKIASRLDSFNVNGSNLVIKNIEHIHIQLTFLS